MYASPVDGGILEKEEIGEFSPMPRLFSPNRIKQRMFEY
jgi:hypothetical protein